MTRLFLAIDKIWQKDFPKLTIHTFGGFTYRCDEYANIEHILKKFPLKIASPSTRAIKFISNHFEKNDSLFFKVPFPVTSSLFHFEDDLYQVAKKSLKVENDNKVITYAGRIAEGKNLSLVIQSALQILKENPKTILFIAGESDDSLTPGFAKSQNTSNEDLESEVRSRIRFLGKFSKDELKLLFHATDVFLSLSTYPLEDFGMAPLEALTCGCPAVLTNWGGYTDFASKEEDCKLVDVTLSDKGHLISIERVTEMLKEALNSLDSAEIRRARSQKYIQQFSPESIAKEVRLLHEKPYSLMNGFSPFARAYVWINKGEILAKVKDTFYHSLYRSYFE